MAVNRETIEILISGGERITDLEKRLDRVSGAAIDVVNAIEEVNKKIKGIESIRAGGKLAGPRLPAALETRARQQEAQEKRRLAILNRQQDRLNQAYAGLANSVLAQKAVIDANRDSIIEETRKRKFESRQQTTAARVARLQGAAARIGSGEAFSPSIQAEARRVQSKISVVGERLAEIDEYAKVLLETGRKRISRISDPTERREAKSKLSGELLTLEATREQLSRQLRSTVEELREVGRTGRGQKATYRMSEEIARKRDALTQVYGVSDSRLRVTVGSERVGVSQALAMAANQRDAGNVQGARDILTLVKQRLSSIEKDIQLDEKIRNERQKLFAAEQSLQKQRNDALSRLAKTESDISAGKRVPQSAAQDYAFWASGGGGVGATGRSQLMLPPARGYSAFQPLPREALLPTGGARLVGQSREFLVGPGGRRTNIPEQERLGIASLLPFDPARTAGRGGRSVVESIFGIGQVGTGGTGIFDVFRQVARDFGKNLSTEIDQALSAFSKGQAKLSKATGLAQAVSMRAESISQPGFGDYSDLEKFLGRAKELEKLYSQLTTKGASEIADFDKRLGLAVKNRQREEQQGLKGQEQLSKAAGLAQAVSMKAESISRPDFGDYSDLEKFLETLNETERAWSSLNKESAQAIKNFDAAFAKRRGVGGNLIDIAESGLSPQRQFKAIGQLPGVDLSRPATMSTANLNKVSEALAELRGGLDLTDARLRNLGNSIDKVQARYGRELERRDPGADILTRRLGPRGGRALSEGLIGGAFPLLFGQGPGASLGGLIGGSAGGFAGGMLGFGASLIGTAAGQALDDLRISTAKTGDALRDVIGNFNSLEQMSILASRGQESLIKTLIDSGQVSTAYGLIQEELNRKIGSSGVQSLIEAGAASDRLGRAIAELGKQIEVAVSGPLTSFLNLVSGFLESANLQGRFERAVQSASPQARNRILPGLRQQAASSATAPVIDLRRIFGNTFDIGSLPRAQVSSAMQQLEASAPKPKLTEREQANKSLREAEQLFETQQRNARVSGFATEAADIYRGLKQQILSAAREQQDVFKQGFEVRKRYEEQIADIRKSIADRVTQVELDNRKKELDIIAKQNDLREQGFKNAAAALQNRLAGNELSQKLASAVDTFFSAQLNAQNQLEQQRMQFEVEMARQAIETEKYKADVAKNVAKLNTDTAKQIEQINLNVLRKNEDARLNEFNSQKQIALTKARTLQQQVDLERAQNEKLKIDVAAQTVAFGETPWLKSVKNITNSISDNLTSVAVDVAAEIQRIQGLSAPAQLRGVAAPRTQAVNTSALDKTTARAKALLEQFQGLEGQMASLVGEGNITALAGELDRIAFSDAWQRIRELNQALSESQLVFGKTDASIKAVADSYDRYIQQIREDRRYKPEQIATLEKSLEGYKREQIALERLQPTIRFYIDTIKEQAQETQRLSASVSELLSPLSKQQRITAILDKSGGIGIDTEQRKSIIDSAKNIDLLSQKLRMLERVKDFAKSWTDAFIGFNAQLLKTGDLGKSVKGWVDEIAGKSVDLVLEMTLRPMQEQLFKDITDFLGFEMPEDPTLKPLGDILGSIDAFRAEMSEKLAPLREMKVAAPLPSSTSASLSTPPAQLAANSIVPTSGAIGNMLPGTAGGPNINEGIGWGRGRFHAGRDLGLDIGDPIHARRSGVVTRAYSSGFGKVGGAVVIKYDDGMEGTYGHTIPSVNVGQSVSAGQRIATVATDPRPSNTHLHYELRDQLDRVIEPLQYIKESLRSTPGTKLSAPLAATAATKSVTEIPVQPFADAVEPATKNMTQLGSSALDTYNNMTFFSDQLRITAEEFTGMSKSISLVSKEEESRLGMMKQFGDVLGEGIKIVGSAAMIFGGIDTMKKGGAYNTLVGLSSIFGGLSGATKNVFGLFGGKLPGFANGGRPPLNGPSIVGERGPEIWWPDSAGTVIPMDEAIVSGRQADPYAETRAYVSAAASSRSDSYSSAVEEASTPLELNYNVVKVGELELVTKEQYQKDTKRIQRQTQEMTLRKIKYSASVRKGIGIDR